MSIICDTFVRAIFERYRGSRERTCIKLARCMEETIILIARLADTSDHSKHNDCTCAVLVYCLFFNFLNRLNIPQCKKHGLRAMIKLQLPLQTDNWLTTCNTIPTFF